ncbi:MAG: hypothetical protein MK171_02025 [Pirellulales bacterium]|nr:hypothetical protein [Pirellulales bacterium]
MGANRDPHVVAAAWEEESLPPDSDLGVGDIGTGPSINSGANRSAGISIGSSTAPPGVEQPGEVYDPFDEDDSIAQLQDNDLFDELTDDPTDEPEPAADLTDELSLDSTDPDMAEAEGSIEEKIQQHKTENDLFEDKIKDRLSGSNRLEDQEDFDSFEGEDWLRSAIESTNDLLEDSQGDQQGTDLDSPEADADLQPTAENPDERRTQLAKERAEHDRSCADEFSRLRHSGLRDIDLSIRVEGNPGEDFPHECALGSEQHEPREWPLITYSWKASALCHKPLYFEQVRLERYGHTWGPYVQPIMSGVHFFGSVPVLPYKMGIRTPSECVYALGYYRPGSCAPCMIDPVPFTWRAALFQAGAVTGISAVIP